VWRDARFDAGFERVADQVQQRLLDALAVGVDMQFGLDLQRLLGF